MSELNTIMPAIFIGHGSPGNILENNPATQMWDNLASEFSTPKGIVCVSAHWYIDKTAVTANETPRTIHDFGGFPPAMYEMQYPAPGSVELANKVVSLLVEEDASLDTSWGFDHGTWCVLSKVYPKADIPVVQLSIDRTQNNEYHFNIGKKLAALREQGYLILGSGNIVHNLGVMNWNARNTTYPWAQRFGDYIRNAVTNNTPEHAVDYLAFGPEAQQAVPSPDHYLPLLYVLGARQPTDNVTFKSQYCEYGSLDMTTIILQ